MSNFSSIADKYDGTPYAMPTGTDLTESQQPAILAVNIVCLSLSIICVGLRIWARTLTKVNLALDDYLMIPCLIVGIIFFCFNTLWMVHRGLGKHIWATGDVPEAIEDFSFGLWVLELCYTSIIMLVKFSLLAFYHRIFRVQSIKKPLYCLTAVVAAWGIALWLTTVFQCVPVRGYWDKTIESKCSVDVAAFFLGNSIPNIITDVAMMILPLPYIYKLQLKTPQKIALAVVFMLGTFVVIISATRLKFILALDLTDVDLMWNFVDTEIWSTLEVYIAIICACLPSIRPVLALVFTKAMGSRSRGDSRFAMNSNLNSSTRRKLSGQWGALKNEAIISERPVVGSPGSDEERLVEGIGHQDVTSAPMHGTVGSTTTIAYSQGSTNYDSDVDIAKVQAGKAICVTTDIRTRWS